MRLLGWRALVFAEQLAHVLAPDARSAFSAAGDVLIPGPAGSHIRNTRPRPMRLSSNRLCHLDAWYAGFALPFTVGDEIIGRTLAPARS